MKEIYLIRHSAPFIEIENYSDYKNVSWSDYNRNMILSPLGEELAKNLCNIKELTNVDSIYSSDSFRAIGTAKYLAEKNKTKIKLDKRINERILGCDKISSLPDNFTINSYKNKDLKFNNGESLNEVDKRFHNFINEIINSNDNKIVLVIHGIILTSYLQTICSFNFDGKTFKISFNNKEVINRRLTNPDVFKLEVNAGKIINIKSLEI